jgi:hypothetical protein
MSFLVCTRRSNQTSGPGLPGGKWYVVPLGRFIRHLYEHSQTPIRDVIFPQSLLLTLLVFGLSRPPRLLRIAGKSGPKNAILLYISWTWSTEEIEDLACVVLVVAAQLSDQAAHLASYSTLIKSSSSKLLHSNGGTFPAHYNYPWPSLNTRRGINASSAGLPKTSESCTHPKLVLWPSYISTIQSTPDRPMSPCPV